MMPIKYEPGDLNYISDAVAQRTLQEDLNGQASKSNLSLLL